MVGALPSSVVAVSHDHAELLAAVSLFLVSANVRTSISHYRSRLCWVYPGPVKLDSFRHSGRSPSEQWFL